METDRSIEHRRTKRYVPGLNTHRSGAHIFSWPVWANGLQTSRHELLGYKSRWYSHKRSPISVLTQLNVE